MESQGRHFYAFVTPVGINADITIYKLNTDTFRLEEVISKPFERELLNDDEISVNIVSCLLDEAIEKGLVSPQRCAQDSIQII